MPNVCCKNCGAKIPVIDLRVAHDKGIGLTCANCPRSWEFEQIGAMLDRLDAKRLGDQLKKSLDRGTTCPCCKQFAKRYSRKFNSIMACWLIAFYRAHLAWPENDYLHVDDVSRFLHSNVSIRSGDYAKARFWGLLEPSGERSEGKKTSGLWRLTDEGRKFVRGSTTIQRRAIVFNNAGQGFEGKEINIGEALGDRFDYEELMAVPPPVSV
jgi:hypothetical protein